MPKNHRIELLDFYMVLTCVVIFIKTINKYLTFLLILIIYYYIHEY